MSVNASNKNILFRGNTLTTVGNALKVGDSFPQFQLVGTDMAEVTNSSFAGKIALFLVVPSLDTPTCQIETKRFNDEASELSGEVVIPTVSVDLPFAQKRWCGAENVQRVIPLSDYKFRTFGEATGTYAQEIGLLVRAIFVTDRQQKIVHVEYVADISQEPNYESALSAVRSLL